MCPSTIFIRSIFSAAPTWAFCFHCFVQFLRGLIVVRDDRNCRVFVLGRGGSLRHKKLIPDLNLPRRDDAQLRRRARFIPVMMLYQVITPVFLKSVHPEEVLGAGPRFASETIQAFLCKQRFFGPGDKKKVKHIGHLKC